MSKTPNKTDEQPVAALALAGLAPDIQTAIVESKSPDEFALAITAAIEVALGTALKGLGPVGAVTSPLATRVIVSQIVAPLVGSIITIVQHIGMAVPMALGDLIERLESGVGFDINGDGFVGNPEDTHAD